MASTYDSNFVSFLYDPVFFHVGAACTFTVLARIHGESKSREISFHRAKAISLLRKKLSQSESWTDTMVIVSVFFHAALEVTIFESLQIQSDLN